MSDTLFGNPDINTRGSNRSLTSPSTSWNSRRKHVSNLTINVQSTMGWRPRAQALHERTNAVGPSPMLPTTSSPPSMTTSYTPDPTFTFGVPHQANFDFKDDGPSTGSSSYSDFSSPQTRSTDSSPPPTHTRTKLQPYSVPSTFTHYRSVQVPKTSASSRAMSRSFSLTPTVAESDYQSKSSTTRKPSHSQSTSTSRLRSNSSKYPPGISPFSNSSFRSSSNPNSKYHALPPLSAFSRPYETKPAPTTPVNKRQRRYSLAESSLLSSLSHLVPLQTSLHSPTHIQQREIEGLKKAIVAIDERLNEERALLESLKNVMSQGNEEDFDGYKERRNERWRIQKRMETLEEEKKRLMERMKVLSSPSASTTKGVPAKEPNQTQPPTQADYSNSRMERNLQMFLAGTTSPTRASLSGGGGRQRSHYRRHHQYQRSLFAVTGPRSRRMTMNDVEPMKLRRLSVEETFIEAMKAYAKSAGPLNVRTTEGTDRSIKVTAHMSAPPDGKIQIPMLTSVVEGDDEGDSVDVSVPSPELEPDHDHEVETEQNEDDACSSTDSTSDLDDDDDDDPPSSPDTGTALIFRHHLLPPEIQIGDIDIEFEMPTYARDLFTRFDRERGEVDVGFRLPGPSASNRSLSIPALVPQKSPKKLQKRFGRGKSHGSRLSHPSPSTEIGHGILMPRPSLVLPEDDGHHGHRKSPSPSPSPLVSPTDQFSRPLSVLDSLNSRTPRTNSRVSFLESNLDLGVQAESGAGSPVKKLKRKLSKKIFMKW